MKMLKRLLGASLAIAMTATLLLPVHAADPLANSFVTASVSAPKADTAQQKLRVDLLRRNSQGKFAAYDSVQYTCGINRAAGTSAKFTITPKADKVWVEVDYLTDLDGNGTYEMLDGQSKPVNDIMNTKQQLVPRDGVTNPPGNASYVLTKDKSYSLSATVLKARAQEAIKARNNGQAASCPVLYYISVHYYSTSDNKSYTTGYYLSLFDKVIVPSDVKPTAWYYKAIEDCMAKGLFSGTGKDTFTPNGIVTRAQMAQILWNMGGNKTPGSSSFSDVKTSDWFYKAVSWCKKEGLMAGTGNGMFSPKSNLTREQVCVVLYNYAKHTGKNVSKSQSLSGFKDGSSVSSWAKTATQWAVAEGLMSGYNGYLNPRNGITRAELATVLSRFYK